MVVGFTERQRRGQEWEDRACRYLQAQGLELVQRNYRVARGPSARGGEIDLILRDRDGTLVFVEVRGRSSACAGGAAASIDHRKRRSLAFAASVYLRACRSLPPCRFDVVAIDGETLRWSPAAFDLSS